MARFRLVLRLAPLVQSDLGRPLALRGRFRLANLAAQSSLQARLLPLLRLGLLCLWVLVGQSSLHFRVRLVYLELLEGQLRLSAPLAQSVLLDLLVRRRRRRLLDQSDLWSQGGLEGRWGQSVRLSLRNDKSMA